VQFAVRHLTHGTGVSEAIVYLCALNCRFKSHTWLVMRRASCSYTSTELTDTQHALTVLLLRTSHGGSDIYRPRDDVYGRLT